MSPFRGLAPLCLLGLLGPPLWAAPPLSGEEIMRRVNAREKGSTGTVELSMQIFDQNQKLQRRRILGYRRPFPSGTRTLYVMTEPAVLKGFSILVHENLRPGEPDPMWMFFPANKKVLEVASRGLQVFGTDFTYEELKETFSLEDFTHRFLREEAVAGQTCLVIERKPKGAAFREEIGYANSLGWVRRDNWMVVRALYQDARGKTLRRLQAGNLERIDGVWTARRLSMEDLVNERRTILEFTKIDYAREPPEAIFTLETLKAGGHLAYVLPPESGPAPSPPDSRTLQE